MKCPAHHSLMHVKRIRIAVAIYAEKNTKCVCFSESKSLEKHSSDSDVGTYGRTICEKFDVNRTIKSVRGRSGSLALRLLCFFLSFGSSLNTLSCLFSLSIDHL